MNVLLVDGYNMIGAWPELARLREKDYELARNRLIDMLSEYRAYTGYRVIIVFDAHLQKGTEKKHTRANVEIIYTKENETADEYIEKLAISLRNIKTQIHVATSDFTEQWSIFGQGALRISARELLREIQEIKGDIGRSVKKNHQKKLSNRISMSEDVAQIFEKWRRRDR
ncbi:NYN domain-containing protein [Aureibacillus halotolerans]|uniref:NYN domain-containing protein n=1 Tax=Aureibacillus halotolerans TaxID=1508390 RepID=A0A4R6TU02_9BACI|nr:NYN domain-containing protein [Aureibacillus halotolerans]TDQ34692.1 hypothetical protein EV213_12318 [Aureibacillus halotolerans]